MIRLEDLRVGMKVRIVDERVLGMNSGGHMDKWLGQVMTVNEINAGDIGRICMKEDAGECSFGALDGWSWRVNMIKEIVTEDCLERGGDIMAKEMLEVGMVVVLRNGDVRTVVNTANMGLVLANGTKAAELVNYNDSLENKGSLGENFDIMEVYGLPSTTGRGGLLDLTITTNGRELVWKRDDAVEMTMEELNTMLIGLGKTPVKIVE